MDRAQVTPHEIGCIATDLRSRQRRLLTELEGEELQRRAVLALACMAERWRDPTYTIRRRAEQENAGFPFAMVWVSLDALLASWTEQALCALIREEGLAGEVGPELIGHVIASNTPLLSWTSIARAILLGSASLVKLPTHPVAAWAGYFHQSLAESDPDLAGLVELSIWKGGDPERDRALCEGCDLMLAYGSDGTIRSLERLMPAGKRLVGYGHRVSFGVVESEAGLEFAANGFARDVLLYDQGGCLSPHCLFVEGNFDASARFAQTLAGALADACKRPECALPALEGDTARAAAVNEERMLARMQPGARLWEDHSGRWTVILAHETRFYPSITHGVVWVAPFTGNNLNEALSQMRPHLQGAAIAARDVESFSRWRELLAGIGVSYVCPPGELQRPPFDWRQNGLPILRLLVS